MIKSTAVLIGEVLKFAFGALLLIGSGQWHAAIRGWTLRGSLVAAGTPAAIFALQNILIQVSVRRATGGERGGGEIEGLVKAED